MRLAACAIALVALAAAAESPRDFRRAMPLLPSGAEGLQRVELTIDVHRGAARADLGDLRLFNGGGERLPFAFAGEPAPSPPPTSTTVLPLFPIRGPASAAVAGVDLRIRQRPDGTLIALRTKPSAPTDKGPVVAWIADATRLDDPLRSLRFSWAAPSEGVVGRLRVEAGDDLVSWRTVAAQAPMVDLSHGGERVRQDTVEVPGVRAKYLRFTWLGPALALESVVAETLGGAAPRPLRDISVEAGPGESGGELFFAVEARVPVERLRIHLPQANSVVPVRIDSRDDPKSDWRPAASATVYRIRRDGTQIASPPIAIAPRAHRYWRVTADQRGGGFGEGKVVLELGWHPRQVVFALRGEGPFELAVGNARSAPAAYPITTLMPDYRLHDEFTLPAASLGAMSVRAGAEGAGFAQWLEDADGRRAMLWALLFAGVALLAAMAWRLARQVKAAAGGAEAPEGRDGTPGPGGGA